jgi:histidyl-tRNA synthetase
MATSDTFREPVGTKDVLAPESRIWQSAITKFAHRAHLYNYDLIVNPTFENYEVFSRVGEDTDIVTKEMYDFYDKGERHISLRPEATAQVARAFAQHRPIAPFKAWYLVSNFRYERPQKGRLREHHQLGIEVLGIQNPLVDVEVIQFAHEFLHDCGLTQFSLSINSLGDSEARRAHMDALRTYFAQYEKELGEEFAARVAKNPLRILDTKVPEWQDMVESAPQINQFLSTESKNDFDVVLQGLSDANIEFHVVPRLVRGLDYYTNTTFEFISSALDAAQSTVCGGGRYNKLVAELGGPETPGVGFSLGIERLLLAAESENVQWTQRSLDVFVIDLAGTDDSRRMLSQLKNNMRTAGVSVDSHYGSSSMKSAMKNADRSGATFCILLGENELANNSVTVKNMNSGEQSELVASEVISHLKK